jgi:putative ABC transport system substrate-binding protein
MKRREFITLLSGAAAWPLAARAQQGDRVRRIGVLMAGEENDPVYKTRLSAFTQALAGLGWTDGRNARMDVRWAGDDTNRIRALAQELVGLRPDIILTTSTPTTIALQRETRTIPIVFASAVDPVASGIVPRLNQPGGNITGFGLYEPSLGGKWLELLSEIAPALKRAAIMFNPDRPTASAYMPSLETAARSLKVAPIVAPVHSDVEIETAIIALGREPGGGLVVVPDGFAAVHGAPIISAVEPQALVLGPRQRGVMPGSKNARSTALTEADRCRSVPLTIWLNRTKSSYSGTKISGSLHRGIAKEWSNKPP